MSGKQVIYSDLLNEHGLIQIPMIQRDFAQGRESEWEVREQFLSALEDALRLPADDPHLPLNLDFIYGSVEGDGEDSKFAPLDGQQRLTTLFLLHWFLAWNDNQWEAFDRLFLKDGHSRFTYRVRPSSTEFFDFLVNYRPENTPSEINLVSSLIRNQSGYFRSWRLDPTIQSTLVMLDAIRNRFVDGDGLFQRLTDSENPAITFQLLPLDKFGLSDDLYIKMNARGVPLTPFETFKARYEQELKEQFGGRTRSIGDHEFPIHDFVSRRMDTAWMDLFWAENKGSRNRSAKVDQSILNLFRVIAMITRNPESEECEAAIEILTKSRPNYTTFHENAWLDEEFTATLIPLLEAWCGDGGGLHTLLPDNSYFDEKRVFSKLTADSSSLEVSEILEFMGYSIFIRTHEDHLDSDVFQEWMRVVHNLVINSTNIDRADRLPGGMKGLIALLPESATILEHLEAMDISESVGTFEKRQVHEESLKAALLNHHENWKPLIDEAELHEYFRGQIGFLLEFSGTNEAAAQDDVSDWGDETHEEQQSNFEDYLSIAKRMFGPNGVIDPDKEFLWQRALLTIGDYMFPMTAQRQCFLLDSYTEANSWKRLLRGYTSSEVNGRELLQKLWDELEFDDAIHNQLCELIDNASGLESWRDALVKSASTMAYCAKRIIRRESATQVYLLAKMQMNGAHAELFTYRLYRDTLIALQRSGKIEPLNVSYFEANDRYFEPGIQFYWTHVGHTVQFDVEWTGNGFLLFVNHDELEGLDDLSQGLLKDCGFNEAVIRLEWTLDANVVLDGVLNLCEVLKSFGE